MIKRNIIRKELNSSNSGVNSDIRLNVDDISNLISKLSNIVKNHIIQLKTKISQIKEILSFIEKRIIFVQTIVKNIINHNYNFEQLKSLDETMIKIKEKNNNILNLINDEENINYFSDETQILLKSINQNNMKNMYEFSSYISLHTMQKYNNSDKKKQNNIYHSTNDNNHFEKIFRNDINKSFDGHKRIKSYDRKNKIKRSINRSQNILDNSYLKNKNRLCNTKDINLFNYNLPLKKYRSIFNIDIQDEVLSKKNCRSEKRLDIKKKNKNLYQEKYKLNANNINYIKKNNNFKKEINNRNLNNLLFKNNIDNINKLILSEKSLIKERGNNSKDKYKENDSRFRHSINVNNINIKSEINKNLVNSLRLKNSILSKDSNHRIKTESFLSSKVALNNNISNNFINENNEIERKKRYSHLILSDKNYNLNHINRLKFLENENNLIKSKLNNINIEYNQKNEKIENENIIFKNEIIRLKSKLKNEIQKNEELNQNFHNQKIKFELEISKINDKRIELSKFLSNKNSEIIILQQELMIKNKEIEEKKLLLNKKETEKNLYENDKMKKYYIKIIKEKENNNSKLINEINILKEKNRNLINEIEQKRKKESSLSNNIKQLEEEISKEKLINNNIDLENKSKYELTIKQLKEENDGLKQFVMKQKELLNENEKKDEKISSLQKEKDILKQYFIDMEIPLPNTQADLSPRTSKSKKEKIKTFESKFTEEECFNILMQLNDAKKEIISLKKKNEELFNELENKKLKNDCFDVISATKPISNYEEEFDLKKMAKGMKEKNRSEDINIDYPGIQLIKEKYRELNFYYNSLEELVKKMLLNINCTNKNKTYICELCKIVGFDDDLTYKILNNKVKKGIKNIFG